MVIGPEASGGAGQAHATLHHLCAVPAALRSATGMGNRVPTCARKLAPTARGLHVVSVWRVSGEDKGLPPSQLRGVGDPNRGLPAAEGRKQGRRQPKAMRDWPLLRASGAEKAARGGAWSMRRCWCSLSEKGQEFVAGAENSNLRMAKLKSASQASSVPRSLVARLDAFQPGVEQVEHFSYGDPKTSSI